MESEEREWFKTQIKKTSELQIDKPFVNKLFRILGSEGVKQVLIEDADVRRKLLLNKNFLKRQEYPASDAELANKILEDENLREERVNLGKKLYNHVIKRLAGETRDPEAKLEQLKKTIKPEVWKSKTQSGITIEQAAQKILKPARKRPYEIRIKEKTQKIVNSFLMGKTGMSDLTKKLVNDPALEDAVIPSVVEAINNGAGKNYKNSPRQLLREIFDFHTREGDWFKQLRVAEQMAEAGDAYVQPYLEKAASDSPLPEHQKAAVNALKKLKEYKPH